MVIETINVLQKKCIRLINFSPFNCHTISLFAENHILKLEDSITANKLKLALDFKTNNIPSDLMNMFTYSSDVHSHNTRNAANHGFHVPRVCSTNFGINTLKYSVPITWNKFILTNPQICNFNHPFQLKSFLNKLFISQYKL